MKVYSQIGSKERFLEMFQNVNKIKLNENVGTDNQSNFEMIERAFEGLKNRTDEIKQTNTQVDDNDNFVEIITINGDTENTFKFKVESSEDDMDGVYNITNASLIEFDSKSPSFNINIPENMMGIEEFNQNHADEIVGVVSDFANFETDEISIDDKINEDVARLIDNMPYNKGTEKMQTHKSYINNKPVNPKIRVKSPELDKFISEVDKYLDDEYLDDEYTDDEYTNKPEDEDILALPPEYSVADIPKNTDDDGSIGIDPYDQISNDDDDDYELDDKETQIILQAYDNLKKNGISSPTIPQITAEANKIKGVEIEPQVKTRGLSSDRPSYLREDDYVPKSMLNKYGVDFDDLAPASFNTSLTPEMKEKYIRLADKMLTDNFGAKKQNMSSYDYIRIVKDLAIKLFQRSSQITNEDVASDYPDPIGKKFKPKNQMPKKKKKPHSTVNISEDDLPTNDENHGYYQYDGNLDPLNFKKMKGVEVLTNDDLPRGWRLINQPEVSECDCDDDTETTNLLLGYKSYNVGEDFDFASQEREYHDNDNYNRYLEYIQKPFKDLTPQERDDLVNLLDQFKGAEPDINEDEGNEYQGNIGDKYKKPDGEILVVNRKTNDGVVLNGKDGEDEVRTSSLELEKVNENRVKLARQALNKRGLSEGITKKEAIEILIRHNIK